MSFYVLIMDKFIQLKNIQVTQSGGEVYSASFKPGYYISLAVFDVPMSKYKRQKRVLVETSHDDSDKEKIYYELFFTNDKTGFALYKDFRNYDTFYRTTRFATIKDKYNAAKKVKKASTGTKIKLRL